MDNSLLWVLLAAALIVVAVVLLMRRGSNGNTSRGANDAAQKRHRIDLGLRSFEVTYGQDKATPEGRDPTISFERMNRSAGYLLRIRGANLYGLGELSVVISKLKGDTWVDSVKMPLRSLNGQLVGDVPHFETDDRLSFRLASSVPTATEDRVAL